MWTLTVLAKAERELAKLPREIQSRFIVALEALEQDPRTPRPGASIKPMRGKTTWRLRVGDYRAIHELVDSEIIVTRFGKKPAVYR